MAMTFVFAPVPGIVADDFCHADFAPVLRWSGTEEALLDQDFSGLRQRRRLRELLNFIWLSNFQAGDIPDTHFYIT